MLFSFSDSFKPSPKKNTHSFDPEKANVRLENHAHETNSIVNVILDLTTFFSTKCFVTQRMFSQCVFKNRAQSAFEICKNCKAMQNWQPFAKISRVRSRSILIKCRAYAIALQVEEREAEAEPVREVPSEDTHSLLELLEADPKFARWW